MLSVELGADLEAKDNYGITALHFAAGNGHVDVVGYLIRKGANVEAKNVFGSTTLLVIAKKQKTANSRKNGKN
jgi:ankyrin repeat protein